MSKECACVHYDMGKCKKFSDSEVTSWCFEGPCKDRTPSNADCIRSMTDEEMADWLARTQIANVAEALEIARIPWEQKDGLKDEMKKECLEWLQEPAKEDLNG